MHTPDIQRAEPDDGWFSQATHRQFEPRSEQSASVAEHARSDRSSRVFDFAKTFMQTNELKTLLKAKVLDKDQVFDTDLWRLLSVPKKRYQLGPARSPVALLRLRHFLRSHPRGQHTH